MLRSVTPEERNLIRRVALRLSPEERDRLLADLERAHAEAAVADGARISFHIAGYARPVYRGQHLYGAEGKMLDQDGTPLSVLLYADEAGHLLELEFVRWGSGNLIAPNWQTLELY